MSMQLDEPRRAHKEFEGRNKDQMPVLLEEGYVPMGVAGIMQRRLEVLSASPEVKDAWWENYWDTGDASVRHPDGRLKIVHDSEDLRGMTSETRPVSSGIQLTGEAYGALQGEEFSKDDVAKYTGNPMIEKDVLKNPMWLALARGDKGLLKEYAGALFSEAKERWDRSKNMGVYVAGTMDDPNLRLWCVGRLGVISNGDAVGCSSLGSSNGRLAGVAPEALGVEKSGAPKIVAPRLEQILTLGREHVSKAGMPAFEEDTRALYKR